MQEMLGTRGISEAVLYNSVQHQQWGTKRNSCDYFCTRRCVGGILGLPEKALA